MRDGVAVRLTRLVQRKNWWNCCWNGLIRSEPWKLNTRVCLSTQLCWNTGAQFTRKP